MKKIKEIDWLSRSLGILLPGIFSMMFLNQCHRPINDKPNILMIVVDDMNYVFDNPDLKIPNIYKLSNRGTLFSNSFCSAPRCAPSRASFLLGLLPSTTGLYYHSIPSFNDSTKYLNNYTTLHQSFKSQGYTTGIYGKVFHGKKIPKDNYSEGYYSPHAGFWGDFDEEKISGFKDLRYAGGSNFAWGRIPGDTAVDDFNVGKVVSALKEKHNDPFFFSIGLVRPHLPWIVPEKFFDLYPVDKIELPPGVLDNDLSDVPDAAAWFSRMIPGSMLGETTIHDEILKNKLWKEAIQAYYASISYADYQIGKILGALEQSRYSENTVVVLFSDHGYHLGEKEHWTKFTLWEKTNHVPFIISLPGQKESIVNNSPISLLDVYPTLISLAELNKPGTHQLEGIDISEMILNPQKQRGKPVTSTYGYQNHSIRIDGYRYISYKNGEDELYNLNRDPYEFKNLVVDSYYNRMRDSLKNLLPVINTNYELDGKTLGWEQYYNKPEN